MGPVNRGAWGSDLIPSDCWDSLCAPCPHLQAKALSPCTPSNPHQTPYLFPPMQQLWLQALSSVLESSLDPGLVPRVGSCHSLNSGLRAGWGRGSTLSVGVWAKAEVGNQGSRRGWAGSEAGAPFSPASLLLPPGPQGHLPTPTPEAFCGLHAKGPLPGPWWKSLEGKSCFFNNSPHGAGPDALGRGSPLGHTGCRPALSCFPGKCPQSLSLTCPPSPSSLLCSLGLLGLLTLWPSVLASSGHLSLLTGQTTGYRRRLWAEPQVCQRWPSGGGCLFFPMWPERTPCTLRGKGAAALR